MRPLRLGDGRSPRLYQPESRYAWTGDIKGDGFIHQEEDFKPWIDAMVPHLHRYLELLRLMVDHAPNEIVPNLFSAAVAVQPFVIERTPFNSNHVDMDLNEGQVLIFPSKTLHQTITSETDDERVSLVADIASCSRPTPSARSSCRTSPTGRRSDDSAESCLPGASAETPP